MPSLARATTSCKRGTAAPRNSRDVPKNITQFFKHSIVIAEEAVGIPALFLQRANQAANLANKTKQSGVHIAVKPIRGGCKSVEFLCQKPPIRLFVHQSHSLTDADRDHASPDSISV